VARGEPASPASDLWSLGATLYAAVEGRPPYDHETAMATLSALVTSEPDPPLRAGPLRPVLAGLLTKEPARRLGADHTAELLALAATPPLPPRQPQRARRGLAERAGVVPVVTVGVLALAVGAGVLAGVKGRPALYSGDPSPSGTPTATPSATARTEGGPLPATIGGEAGAPSVTRLARGGATWPATSTLTLRLDEDARDRAERVSVIVTCPSGPRRLSFTAYAVGDARSLVSGTCAATGVDAPMTRSLRLPAGVSPARIRVRVRPGPDARSGPVDWYAGVYGTA
jgi:hypothetical protein